MEVNDFLTFTITMYVAICIQNCPTQRSILKPKYWVCRNNIDFVV